MLILPAICIALCLGILTGYFFPASFIICSIFILLCVSVAIIFFRKNKIFVAFILVAVFFLGITSAINKSKFPHDHVSQLDIPFYRKILLRGTIIDKPKEYQWPYRHEFILKAKSVKINKTIHEVRGNVLIKAYQRQQFSYGEEIIIRGGLMTPRKSFGDNVFNYRLHLKSIGIEKMFYSKKKDYLLILGDGNYNSVKKIIFDLKKNLEGFILENMKEREAKILICMILGSREYLDKEIKDVFAKTGTVHILAISGLHVGIIAFMLSLLLKALNIKFTPRCIIVVILIILYSILTGLRSSIVRSSIMVGLYMWGRMLDREVDIYNCLSVAAIAILIFNPYQIFNIGFQLSFISVFSICYFSPKFENLLIKTSNYKGINKVRQFLKKAVIFSASAWLGTWIIIAYYFKVISPVTILANIFVVPYMSLVLAAGFSFLILGPMHPLLASSFAATVEFTILLLIKWVELLSRLPFAYIDIAQISLVWVVVYYTFILIIFCGIAIYKLLHDRDL